MPGYTLVPVDYLPDFNDVSLVPVDYDPFPEDGVAQQWRVQQAPGPAARPVTATASQGSRSTRCRCAGCRRWARGSDGALDFLRDENLGIDSYVYKKLSTGTPPNGPQVTTANGSHTITATGGANRTNFGGVYGHS